MSANLCMYTTVVFGLEHVVRLVPDAAWGNPSPCAEWDARDVAGHAMAVISNVAARAGDGAVVDPFKNVRDVAGPDPVASFRRIRDRYLEATDQPGVLQQVIIPAQGEMTIDHFIGLMCGDALVHTWDLARAAGVDETLEPAAVEAVYAAYRARDMSALRAPNRYGDEIQLDASASLQDRLIAFTGRDPRR